MRLVFALLFLSFNAQALPVTDSKQSDGDELKGLTLTLDGSAIDNHKKDRKKKKEGNK